MIRLFHQPEMHHLSEPFVFESMVTAALLAEIGVEPRAAVRAGLTGDLTKKVSL